MNKKVSIIIIVLLLAITGIIFVFHKKDEYDTPTPNPKPSPSETINYKYLIIDNISNWAYNDGNWHKTSPNVIENKNLLVFIDNQYLGEYKMKYGTAWNLFDKNDNYVNYEGNLLAFSPDFNISIKNGIEAQLTAIEVREISSILGYDIDSNSFTTSEVQTVDLDGVGSMDKIVSVSNTETDSDISLDKYFNLVYVVLNGNLQVLIYDQIKPADVLLAPVYDINSIIDTKTNGYASIILQKGYFSEAGQTGHILFDFHSTKYEKTFED